MIVSNGQHGGQVIADTANHTGRWEAIAIIEAAVFNKLNGNVTGYATVTFPAGFTLFGVFTEIDLTSGKVLAYDQVRG